MTVGATLDAHLVVRLGAFHLDVHLSVAPGTVVAILGPNGAGKSTILRALAGVIATDEGRIALGDHVLDDPATRTFVPPERRGVGLVPQDLLLFPHLSALDNVAFGPRSQGIGRAEARIAAAAWLARVGLADQARARPGTLSGGQAQRVALARSLAAEPDVLLLDEPLSALDPTTRGSTRRDLRRHLDAFAGPAVVVTHDPVDALTLASVVIVVEDGAATQAGPIAEVAARPRTPYVADLLGTNLLAGTASGRQVTVGPAVVEVAEPRDGPVHLTIAPNAVVVHRTEPEGSARNRWPGTVTSIDLLGQRVRLQVDGPVPLVAEITPAALAALDLQVGSEVWTSVKATEVDAYER